MSSESTSVSIIITVKNNGIDLYTTMESLKVSQSTLPYEVIIVDEGSVDGCCDFLMSYRFDRPFKRVKGEPGMSARNLGAAYATGEVLIFCGSHLYYDDGWMERLLAPLMRGQADGVSPAFEMSKHSPAPKGRDAGGVMESVRGYPIRFAGENEIPWLSWECFAVRRLTFRDMGGMEDGFFGKDLETAEFSLRLWLRGGVCRYVPEVTLIQVFRQNFPYDNSGDQWGKDLMSLAYLHFDDEGVSACRELVRSAYEGEPITDAKLSELTMARRENNGTLRKHDVRWFTERFGIQWK
ncbi:glycosyltransferase family 2 protein [Paenibacillus timonensis]|uniref:glycosyltransferase family 2 protein n=1 Tax=Paenibacillus timonensis TaxID=225915 RepID=UPI003F9A0347